MSGLWNKFLVQRRDGSIPEWPWLVMGARDPSTPTAIRAMADWHEEHHTDPEYVADLRILAAEWDEYRDRHGEGDPEAGPHRADNSAIVYLLDLPTTGGTVNHRRKGT